MSVEPIFNVSNYIQALLLIVISLTLCVAIYVQKQKEIFDESGAFLERSIDLINKAYDVLSQNGNVTNKRVSWVTSARLLTRAIQLSGNISVSSHKVIFESEHDYQRHRFGDLLKLDGNDLPIEFFFGPEFTLGQIGKSAFGTINKVGVAWIPTRVISVIYQFKAYPDNFEDPLDSSTNLFERELDKLRLFDHDGIHDYFRFREVFKPILEKIYQVNGSEKPMEINEKIIDQYFS